MQTRNLASDLSRRLEPFLERFVFPGDELERGNWVPAVDVVEEAGRILVRAEVPGVPQEAIDISFTEGVLTIRGTRTFEKEEDSRKYHRIERVYGNFSRSFTLPRTVDPDGISASLSDGILEVAVPKRDEAKPRQIRVDVK